MKVKWISSEAREIPGIGTAQPGAVIEMEASLAQAFIDAKQAEPVREPKMKQAEGGEVK